MCCRYTHLLTWVNSYAPADRRLLPNAVILGHRVRQLAHPIAARRLISTRSLEESRAQSPAICPSDDASSDVAPRYGPNRAWYRSVVRVCSAETRPRVELPNRLWFPSWIDQYL